ncbi:hypothetical protein [Bradyrhizobium sp. 18]|uniref:hypothetical protein n=1 Tax=Bradyrhizobium sp. 18 TaxID=2782657 RepID=UPI001FFBD3DB|nr:hypothetical protein [Bradyrhizobium sp. 18]MCK1503905.1 hypothetical protein [Bradyrhizobium sp. 18]
MEGFERCPNCQKWGWFGVKFGREHQCAPIWEARMHETKWNEDWTEVRAHDAEEAAREFCERYDCDGEYTIIQRGAAEIEVRKPGEDRITIFDVFAESVPTYYAHERKEIVTDDVSAVTERNDG